MEKRLTLGFVLGITGGFINLLYALLVGYAMAASFTDPESNILLPGSAVIAVIIFILLVADFIGACICRNKLAVGRALMYVTGLILLILFIDSLSNLLSSVPEVYAAGLPAYLIVCYAVMIAAQILSVSAAALLSVPASNEKVPEYGGILGIFKQDMNDEHTRDEFQAVHRLYGQPDNIYKAEASKETDTEPVDSE